MEGQQSSALKGCEREKQAEICLWRKKGRKEQARENEKMARQQDAVGPLCGKGAGIPSGTDRAAHLYVCLGKRLMIRAG